MSSYGGIYERGSHEYTLDDFYSLALDKMDRYVCLRKCEIEVPTGENDESSSDEDDDGSDDEETESSEDEDEEAIEVESAYDDEDRRSDTKKKKRRGEEKQSIEEVRIPSLNLLV